jgi:hypothetical protein
VDVVNESLDIEHAPRRHGVVDRGAFRPFSHVLCLDYDLAFVRPTAHPAHHKRAVSPLPPLLADPRHFVQVRNEVGGKASYGTRDDNPWTFKKSPTLKRVYDS